jgi:hypothetical protein
MEKLGLFSKDRTVAILDTSEKQLFRKVPLISSQKTTSIELHNARIHKTGARTYYTKGSCDVTHGGVRVCGQSVDFLDVIDVWSCVQLFLTEPVFSDTQVSVFQKG